MQRYEVNIRANFYVEVDETKFTPEFFAEFSSYMWPMFTVEEAVEHLADLFARGVIRGSEDEFIEGYGPAKDMGIRFFTRHGGDYPDSSSLTVEVEIDGRVEAEPVAA